MTVVLPRLLLAWLAATLLNAQDAEKFFEARVRPVLATRCQQCHNSKVRSGNLDLSGEVGFRQSGIRAERLVEVLRYDGAVKMPPTGKLAAADIQAIEAWTRQGAPWPKTVAAASGKRWAFEPVKQYAIPTARDEKWVRKPVDAFMLARLEAEGLKPSPEAGKLTWLRRATFDLTGLPPTRAEISAFLEDDSADARARVIERLLESPRYGERWGRHWLDVVRFAESTGADEDLRYPFAWRYRDYVVDAFNRDLPYDQFLREQIAGDLLPPEPDGSANRGGTIATGFLSLGMKVLAEPDKSKLFYDVVDEQIDTLGRAVLGLTVACARCHDHKFDPIPTQDYYSLASIFASTRTLDGKLYGDGPVSKLHWSSLSKPEVTRAWEGHQQMLELAKTELDRTRAIAAMARARRLLPQTIDYMVAAWEFENRPPSMARMCVDEFAFARKLDYFLLDRWVDLLKANDDPLPHMQAWALAAKAGPAAVRKAAGAYAAELERFSRAWSAKLDAWQNNPNSMKPRFDASESPFFAEVVLRPKGPFALPAKRDDLLDEPWRGKVLQLSAKFETLKKTPPPEPAWANAVAEGEPVSQKILIRGDVRRPGGDAPKRFPRAIAGEGQTSIQQGSGRRELAEWITKPDHPLTARVMVNRIWQYHFGEGLVRTAGNFGATGEPPTHPELLDYLALEFVQSGWSIKKMHRLLMLSNTYAMSSATTREQHEKDPENRLLSHFHRRRLDVEEMRDGLLAIEGSLDAKMGGTLQTGPAINEFEPLVAWKEKYDPFAHKRRTLYSWVRRSNLPGLLTLFDYGDATSPGSGRSRTNVAPQALYVMNSGFVDGQALDYAKRLLADESVSTKDRIERAYMEILNRPADPSEVTGMAAYIDQFATSRSDAEAWQSFCYILMASNEYMYVD